MYRDAELMTPEQKVETALAELKEFEETNYNELSNLNDYESVLTFGDFLLRYAGSEGLFFSGLIGLVVGCVSSLTCAGSFWGWVLWFLSFFLGFPAAYLLVSRGQYHYIKNRVLRDPSARTAYLLKEGLKGVRDQLNYYKQLFELEDAEDSLLNDGQKSAVAAKLSSLTKKAIKQTKRFLRWKKFRALSAGMEPRPFLEAAIPEDMLALGAGEEAADSLLRKITDEAESLAKIRKCE